MKIASLLKTKAAPKSALQTLIGFLVRGHRLTPQQGQDITHFMEMTKRRIQLELRNKEFIGRTFGNESSSTPNVTAYVNGLGTVNRVVIDESISNLPRNRLNNFIVVAVAKALQQPKEYVHNSLKAMNNECLAQLYGALEAYDPKKDTLVEDSPLRHAFVVDQLYLNALYQQVLEEASKPEGYLHEDEELFYKEKKRELSDAEIDAIMLSEKVPDLTRI
ncbi:hypothetical protein C9374_008171 [Naegleria lovaniensis]|uniref:Uncharacterized protein n=1 Tax=Naegleria lovaniensis TaxID=51637 RepID=A0AA88GFJ6_NAELO|nr:uncharacterized protein C9374_008171 [Naegleria lovaniensis]KAG2378532.1 hypothetical protein C9374_008171 [Naegleria lovaniensis]